MVQPRKQLSVRVPECLYREVSNLSRRRGESVNRLVIAGLQCLLAEGLDREMRRAYDDLAPSECDVEPFLAAQTEVVDDED